MIGLVHRANVLDIARWMRCRRGQVLMVGCWQSAVGANALRRRLPTVDRRPARRGFSLVEAAFAVAIVGVAFVAIMQLWATCTQSNRVASNTTAAIMLASQIQDATRPLPLSDPASGHATFGEEIGETTSSYDDVDDFNAKTFSPPIDSNRSAISDLDGYTQSVRVVPVNTLDLDGNLDGTAIPTSTYTGAVRVTVTVFHGQTEAASLSWIRVER